MASTPASASIADSWFARCSPALDSTGSFGGVRAFSAWRVNMTVTWDEAGTAIAVEARQRISNSRSVLSFIVTAKLASRCNVDIPLLARLLLTRQLPEVAAPEVHCGCSPADFPASYVQKRKLFS